MKGPVNVEVTGNTHDEMIKEARVMATWGEEIVIKIPVNLEGLKVVKTLSSEGIRTNVTLVFSASQALLAAKAGATYVCPFLGRLDDISFNGLELIRQIRGIYQNYDEIKTKIIVASVRHPIHVIESGLMGAEIVTIPPAVLEQMVKHPLTDKGNRSIFRGCKEDPRQKVRKRWHWISECGMRKCGIQERITAFHFSVAPLVLLSILSMGSELRAEEKPSLAILPFFVERVEDPARGAVCPVCKGVHRSGEVVPGLSEYPDAGIIREDGGRWGRLGSPFRKSGRDPFPFGSEDGLKQTPFPPRSSWVRS